jgi:hypothetical protein
MRFVRTILACAIAISLAILPLGASVAGHAMPSDDMQAAMQMTGHDDISDDISMDDCCPNDMKAPVSHQDGRCGMGFCCIGGAITLDDVRMPAFAFFAVTASRTAIPADQVMSFRGGSPPFRPPRI